MKNPVGPSSCVTPAGTSNELDVQNEWEKNTTHTRMYVCMYGHNLLLVLYNSRVWINRVKCCQSCWWSAEQGKCNFLCPRSPLRIWSQETGFAVPSLSLPRRLWISRRVWIDTPRSACAIRSRPVAYHTECCICTARQFAT